MSKSKAVVTEQKSICRECASTISSLLDIMNDMFQQSSNQMAEIYRVSALVSFIAGQKAYMDRLRDQYARCKAEKDISGLKSVVYKLENNLECKVYDDLWTTTAKMYEAMIESLRQESSNDDITYNIKTADEILASRCRYYIEAEERKLDDAIKTVEAWFSL